MRALRIGALGYVIVVLVAMLNKMGGGFVITPAEATFVPFGEGTSIINDNAKEEVLGAFHGGYSVSPTILVSMESALHADREHFKQFFTFLPGLQNRGNQQGVRFVNPGRSIRVGFADAKTGAHVFNDRGGFAIVRYVVRDERLESPGVFGIGLQALYPEREDIRTLQIGEGLFGYIGIFLGASRPDHGGGSGFFSDFDGSHHIHPLLVGGSPQSSGFSEQPRSFPRQNAGEYRYQQVGEFDLEKDGSPVFRRLYLFLAASGALLLGMRLIDTHHAGLLYRAGVALCFIGPLVLVFGWNAV